MKLRSFLLAYLVLVAALVSQGASAQVINRSSVLQVAEDGQGGFNTYFGDTFASATAGSSFSDVFRFQAGFTFDAAASVTSSYLNNVLTKDLLITGLSLYRYDPVTMRILDTAIAGIDIGGAGSDRVDSWSLTGFDLVAGSYALKVDGRVVGPGGGAFGGDLAIAPIPEASSWSMLLGGLAGIAGAGGIKKMARRRAGRRRLQA